MMRRAAPALAALLAAAAVLAGCTDIPSTSPAQRVEVVPPVPVGPPPRTPRPGEQPREIVQDFITLNASADPHHDAARQFLTDDAASRWNDSSGSVVAMDEGSVGTFDAKTGGLVVTGKPVGKLDSGGVYTPSLQGQGLGGDAVQYEFTLKKVGREWRIDRLPSGLMLRADDFANVYKQRPVYFLDASDHTVVPDLRSTNLSGSALQNWLLARLAAGPSPALADAVDSGTFPASANTGELGVTQGSDSLDIEVPGAARLGADARDRLAAQIALTLDRTTTPHSFMTITDGGPRHPVTVPAAQGVQFVPDQFTSLQPTPPPAAVYYLRNGHVVTGSGHELGGRLASAPFLNSIAVARRGVNDALTVAGVVGEGSSSQLYVGTDADGLTATAMHGLTSRPAWAEPGLDEVWAGTGPTVSRYTVGGAVQRVGMPAIPAGGQIKAIRLSPEGARVSLVVELANGNQELFLGTVVRTADEVRVDSLVPISPAGTSVLDASWLDETRLFAIGYLNSNQASQIIEVNVDGSNWQPRGIGILPTGPDYVTVAADNLAWVSAGGSVWEQDGANWVSPGFGEPPTAGDAPVYLE